MPAYFVTATGTEIGKTYVTAGLVRHLRQCGEGVRALKPVVSGFSLSRISESDPGILLEALGEPRSEDAIASISPWRFEAPLAPDMAAAREGREIDFDKLVDFCRERLAETQATTFIEGVGGVLVPLDERHTVRDWMAALRLPVVLVAGSYLGTISHTLTAWEALERAGLKTALLVINESPAISVPLEETVSTLARFVRGTRIVSLPRAGEEGRPVKDFERLWQTLSRPGRA